MRKTLLLLAACAVFVLALPLGASALRINEIRIDNTGTDSDEYFELAGDPNESLDGITYLVIGDASGSGLGGGIDDVIDLTGLTLQADGLLAVHDTDDSAFPAGQCTGYDLIDFGLNFENSDNVTHLLVRDYTGPTTGDLDVDDDGVIDGPPWSALIDCVALSEDVPAGDLVYCGTIVGPDGTFVPGHVYWCDDGWNIGAFDPVCTDDTPGDANTNCPVSVDESTWGGVKGLYR